MLVPPFEVATVEVNETGPQAELFEIGPALFATSPATWSLYEDFESETDPVKVAVTDASAIAFLITP